MTILAPMPVMSLVRVAEHWAAGGVLAVVALIVALGIGIAAMIGRLSD